MMHEFITKRATATMQRYTYSAEYAKEEEMQLCNIGFGFAQLNNITQIYFRTMHDKVYGKRGLKNEGLAVNSM
jgi:hypothetical protein